MLIVALTNRLCAYRRFYASRGYDPIRKARDLRFLPELVTALLVPFLGELVRRGYPLLLDVNQARIVVIAVVLFKVPLVGPWIPIFSVLLQRYRQIAAGVDGVTVLVISVVERRRRRRARRKRRRRAGPAIYQTVFWRLSSSVILSIV